MNFIWVENRKKNVLYDPQKKSHKSYKILTKDLHVG